MRTTKIQEISYLDAWPIRHQVMWPDKPFDYIKLPNDSEGKHFGAFINDELVAVVSLFIKNNKAQFRKLATLQEFQGKGCGSLLLQHCINHCSAMNIKTLWCNARKNKIDFYSKFGMQPTTKEFTKGGLDFIILERNLR